MIAFPSMLEEAAREAGMKVPPNSDEFDPQEFPHFHVFCNVQLCRPIRWGEHWENAKVIAAIPEQELRSATLEQLIERGLEYHS